MIQFLELPFTKFTGFKKLGDVNSAFYTKSITVSIFDYRHDLITFNWTFIHNRRFHVFVFKTENIVRFFVSFVRKKNYLNVKCPLLAIFNLLVSLLNSLASSRRPTWGAPELLGDKMNWEITLVSVFYKLQPSTNILNNYFNITTLLSLWLNGIRLSNLLLLNIRF